MPVVLQLDAKGTYADLKFRDIPYPTLKGKEVLYKVSAFGLNFGEILVMADTYFSSPSYPLQPGQEACGTVEAVGPEVTLFKVGDRVTSIVQENMNYGVNGEFAVTLEDFLVPWPDGFTAEEACSIWSSAITAYYPFVELANVQASDNVLITAGSSTSGVGAIQIAKSLGARVITTSRTLEKERFLKEQGADDVIASDGADVGAEIMRRTQGKGVRVVLDPIAGSFVGQYAYGLSVDAQVFLIGMLAKEENVVCSFFPLNRTGAALRGYSMQTYHRRPDMFARAKSFIQEGIRNGYVKPVIDRVFDFSQSLEAYAHLVSGVQRGKVVVRVAG